MYVAAEEKRREVVDSLTAGQPTAARGGGRPQVERLARAIRAIETASFPRSPEAISTGCDVIDAALPGGGLAPGSLVEWISHGAGDGAFSLALLAARSAMGAAKHAIIIDPERTFYPPAAKALGVALDRLIVLHPNNRADAMWSFDQSLRCPSIAAVISWQDKIDDTNARRLQLAAEQGQTLGLLLRNAKRMSNEPGWAEITWEVRSLPSAAAQNPASQSKPNPTAALAAALRLNGKRPPNTAVYSENFRWLHVQLKRMRYGRGKSNLAAEIAAGTAGFLVALEGRRGPVYAERRALPAVSHEVHYGSTSAVHLASQLAVPTYRSGQKPNGQKSSGRSATRAG